MSDAILDQNGNSFAHDPTGLAAAGGVTITFGNSLSSQQGDLRDTFLDLLSTTQAGNSPFFGGIEDISPAGENFHYNSAPFGNCGELNSMGADYLSATYGYEVRTRVGVGHFITEVDFSNDDSGDWHVVETYGRIVPSRMITSSDADDDEPGIPFFTLQEIQDALTNGDPRGIWAGYPTNGNVRGYYQTVQPPEDNAYTNSNWTAATLTLAANESVSFQVAPYDATDFYGMGIMTPLPSQSASPPADEVTVVRTEDGSSPQVEHIETPYQITGVSIRPYATVPSFLALQSYDAIQVFAVAPAGDVALSNFADANWMTSWTLDTGTAFDTGHGIDIESDPGTPAQLHWTGAYTNNTGSTQTLWIPVAYRTDTPSTDGSAVATLTVAGQQFDLAPTDQQLHYRDVLVTVADGQTVDLAFEVAAGKSMDVVGLGTKTNIGNILSIDNPALAVDVDFSGLQSQFFSSLSASGLQPSLAIAYSLMKDPGDPLTLQPNEQINNQLTVISQLAPYALNEAVVTRTEDPNGPTSEHIDTGFYVTNVDLTPKPGVTVTPQELSAAESAIRVLPTAPAGTIPVSTFGEHNWLNDWSVQVGANYTFNTGQSLIINTPNTQFAYTQLALKSAYVNHTAETQYVWLPMVYRTDTPFHAGIGDAVGDVLAGDQDQTPGPIHWYETYNIFTGDTGLHYAEFIVPVAPGKDLDFVLQVLTGKNIEIYALGTQTDISGIFSPSNPVSSVDVDLSALTPQQRAEFDLSYSLMVNPYLSSENLTGTNDNNTLSGSSADNHLTGNGGDDTLTGLDGSDTLDGGPGNDSLDGGTGDDMMIGGTGDDTYYVDSLNDVIVENPNEGTDTVYVSFSYTLLANFENLVLSGNANLTGTGNAANNVIYSNNGVDTLQGGDGDDTYVVYNSADVIIETPTGGTDTVNADVSFTLPSNVENLALFGTANINATGNGQNNVIYGNSGNNIIDGRAGADIMLGGPGNDTYYVDNAGDTVVENPNEGTDTVRVNFSYTLADNVEVLIFSGNASLTGTGNAQNNTFYSNNGVDTLQGGDGNDIYIVYNGADVITEGANGGLDTVNANVNFTLPTNVENLALFGAGNINGTGNALNNVIYGNNANNTIDGGAGTDIMLGGGGNDIYFVDNSADSVVENPGQGTDRVYANASYQLSANVEQLVLYGNANLTGTGNSGDNYLYSNNGIDTLIGGLGNDIYVITKSQDVVTEAASGGTDAVYASVSYALQAGQEVETLVLTGAADINATGNEIHNTIIGNSGNNIIDGGGGADTMNGGLGNDTYYVDDPHDVIVESPGGGTDQVYTIANYVLPANVEDVTLLGIGNLSVTGNSLANLMVGNSGNDALNGGTGADTMEGGAGNDSYYVDNFSDIVVENPGEGTADRVYATINYTLPNNVEQLVLLGNANLTGVGNAGDNFLFSNSGVDTLVGGAGNDTYVVTNGHDAVTENANEGTDTVQSSVTYLLSANVENLVLTGTGNINGTGNGLANTIIGNGGNNTIDGGGGADTMIGGAGNDIYVVDNAGDTIVENANGGSDYVYTSVSYTLAANVESTTLLGGGNLTVTGNSGNNTFYSNSGVDTLIGGAGNDTYVISSSADAIVENPGGGTDDRAYASVDYTLSANVETLVMTGAGNISGTGNVGNNHIFGNSGNNQIAGAGGTDILSGGGGADTFIFTGQFGNATITDFLDADDDLQFTGTSFTDANDVVNHAHSDATGTTITDSAGDSVFLQHLASISASNIIVA